MDKKRLTEFLIDNKFQTGKRASEVVVPRALGYTDNSPLISQRVVMDTALATETANNLLNLQAPSHCMKIEQRKAVFECLLESASSTLKNCRDKYCN
ncbi:MAG: hypothetical protein ACK41T_13260 [Pseudobdellovibrio sp.]